MYKIHKADLALLTLPDVLNPYAPSLVLICGGFLFSSVKKHDHRDSASQQSRN